MKPVANETIVQQLQWRYATKVFDPSRTIAPTDWQTLEQALVLTPSSYGLQPWKFIVITDHATRERLVLVSWNQRQVADCSHFVVFAIQKHIGPAEIDALIASTASARGIPPEALSGYRGMMIRDLVQGPRAAQIETWASRQAYIALGNFMTVAALLGIDTCPMEGFEPVAYDHLLELGPRGLTTSVACAAGYRAAGDKYATLAKVRYPTNDVVEHL